MRAATIEDAPLRIALYSPNLPGSGGSNGIIAYSGIMRDALRRLGHAVLLLTPELVEHEDGSVLALPRPNPVVARLRRLFEAGRLDGSNVWARLRVFDAFRVARHAGVQVLEIEESFGWAGRLAGRGIPIVERLHGPHAFVRDAFESVDQKIRGNRREAAERASLAQVQAVSSPTQRLLDALIERYGVRPAISRAIPNPMPVAPTAAQWSVHRADPDQILFIGRFDLCKGADVILRAFARALEQRPSLKLVMAGPDRGLARPEGGVTHFDEFIADELSPAARARIRFRGELTPERVMELRLQSALAVVGSRFENFPYSIAEGMSVGMPIITTDTFGGREMIRNERDGLVVPINDAHAMAAAIVQMVTNCDRTADMGRSALLRAAEWLSPERIAREMVAVYREALATIRSVHGSFE